MLGDVIVGDKKEWGDTINHNFEATQLHGYSEQFLASEEVLSAVLPLTDLMS